MQVRTVSDVSRHHRAPSAGFEPAHTAPEADALSPELRGQGWDPTAVVGGVPKRGQARMLMARAATSTIVTSAEPDWIIISAFARPVSGIVSVGPNEVEFVKLVYR